MKNPYKNIDELVEDIGLRDIPFQHKIFNDRCQKVTVRLGRQMGSTTLISVRAIWDAIEKERTTVFVLSPSHRQRSLIHNEMCRHILKSTKLKTVIDIHDHIMDGNLFPDGIFRVSLRVILLEFKNGSRINMAVNSSHASKGYHINSLLVDEADYIDQHCIEKYMASLSSTRSKILLCGTPAGRVPPGLFEKSFWSTTRDMETYYEYSSHWYNYHNGIPAGLMDVGFALSTLKQGITIERFLQDFGAMFPQEIDRQLMTLNQQGLLKYFNRTYMRPWHRLKRWIKEKKNR